MSCVFTVYCHMHHRTDMAARYKLDAQFFHQFFISCRYGHTIHFRGDTVTADLFHIGDTASVDFFSIRFLQALTNRMGG